MINKTSILFLAVSAFPNAVMANFTAPENTLGSGSSYTISYAKYDTRAEADAAALSNSSGFKQVFEYKTVDANNNIVTSYYTYKFTPIASGSVIKNPDYATTLNPQRDFVGLTTHTSSIGGAINSTEGTTYGIKNITGDFIGNYKSGGANSRGAAIYNYVTSATNSIKVGDIKANFIGNYLYNPKSQAQGGAIVNRAQRGTVEIGNITGDFIGNFSVSTYADGSDRYVDDGALENYGEYGATVKIGDITGNFIGNYAYATHIQARRGAIANGVYLGGFAEIGNITGNFIANYAKSDNSYAVSGAIGVFSYSGNNAAQGAAKSITKSISGNFIGNYAQGSTYARAGAIMASVTSSNVYDAYTEVNFIKSVAFIGNYAQAADINDAKGGAIYSSVLRAKNGPLVENYINFYLKDVGHQVLFVNNYVADATTKELNSIYFASEGVIHDNPVVNFSTVAGSLVNIMDPMKGDANTGIVNFSGDGSFYLWGDNSDYTGKMNIDGKKFYMLFDEKDTWAQRHDSILAATTNFGANTIFRPQISETKLANITGTITADTSSLFMPYGISALAAKDYTYVGRNYEAFAHGDPTGLISSSALSDISSDGVNTYITVRNMEGYKNLSAMADIYRRQSNLTYDQRYELDYIYITGQVSQNIINEFEALEGEDYEAYEQIHRTSVRKYNRQVSSRVNNRNCPNCSFNKNSEDDHLWIDYSYNEIKKDDTSKAFGYKYRPNSVAIGYDYDFAPNRLNMGLAFGYASGDVKSNSAHGSFYYANDVDEYLASFYGKYRVIRPYVSWNIGGGIMKNDTKFQTTTLNNSAEYDTYVFFANFEAGYDFAKTVCYKIEPYIGLEYTHLHSEAFNEKGNGGARHFDSVNWYIVEIPVGIRLAQDLFIGNNIYTPSVDLAYSRSIGDKNASTTVNFIGNKNDRWKVPSSDDSRDSYRGTFNLKINSKVYPFALNLGYAIDYRSDYYDQQIYGTIRWDL